MFLFIFLSFFFLILTLTNIAAGCWIAIQLGYGPPNHKIALKLLLDHIDWKELWPTIKNSPALIMPFLRSLPASLSSLSLPSLPAMPKIPKLGSGGGEKKSAEGSPAPTPTAAESAAPATPAKPQTVNELITSIAATSLGDLIIDEASNLTELASMQELFDDELAHVLMDQGPEAWLVNEKNVETSIMKLNASMMKSGRFTAELDSRLRRIRGSSTPAAVKQFKAELTDDCQSYLASQKTVLEQIHKRLSDFGELKSLAEEIEHANLDEEAQIETTVNNLNRLQVDDPEEAVTRLLRELASLRVARHRLRDMQDKAFMKIVTYENRLNTIPPQNLNNEILGIRGRVGIEATLSEWWSKKRHQERHLAFAFLDVVDCGKLNEEHGIAPCDQLLTFLAKSLALRFDPQDLVGMYVGNCFLVVTANIGVKKTLTEIDRFRQYCEKGTFLFNNKESQLKCKLTCAVTEAASTANGYAEVTTQLETVLTAAKKDGKNKTFWIEPGGLPKPPTDANVPDFGEKPHETDITTEPTTEPQS